MKPDWYDLAIVVHQLKEAETAADAEAIWLRHPEIVRGADLVFAADEPTALMLPSNDWEIKQQTDPHPRCLYYTDSLYFMNDRVVENLRLGKGSEINCDLMIMLDSNVAGEIRRFVEGKESAKSDHQLILDFLVRENVNFSYHHYIFENARNFFNKPGHAKFVYETFYSIMFFDYLEKSLYAADGARKASINYRDLKTETMKVIEDTFKAKDYLPIIKGFLNLHYLSYLTILKIVEIEFGHSRKPLETKLDMLLDFMHNGLHRIFQRELIMSIDYFKKRSSVGFMHKINVGCEKPLEKISNIAWDILLFRAMEKFGSTTTKGGKLIPYFISFDKASRDLFDKYRIKALISCGEDAMYHSILKERAEDLLFESIENKSKVRDLQKYFTAEYRDIRRHKLRYSSTPPRKYVRELEKKVCREHLQSSY